MTNYNNPPRPNQESTPAYETPGLAWAPELQSAQDTSPLGLVRAALENELSSDMPTRASAVELFHKAEELITADDEAGTAVVTELVRDGTFHRKPLTPLLGEQAPGNTYEQKLQFLKIYQKDPQAASVLIEKRVTGFHGSSSASLLGVLDHGLLSAAEARNREVRIGSGERLFSGEGGQSTISFSTWRAPETIAQYAHGNSGTQTPSQLRKQAENLTKSARSYERIFGENHTFARNEHQGAADRQALADFIESNPNSLEAKLIQDNFPIAYGINVDDYKIYETIYDLPEDKTQRPPKTIVSRVHSDITGEFMVFSSEVAPEDMPVIAVPSDKINYVRELLRHHDRNEVTVIPLEAIS